MSTFDLSSLTQALTETQDRYGNVPEGSPIRSMIGKKLDFYSDFGNGCLTSVPVVAGTGDKTGYFTVNDRILMEAKDYFNSPAPFYYAFENNGRIIIKYGNVADENGISQRAVTQEQFMNKIKARNCATSNNIVMNELGGLENMMLGKRDRSFGKKKDLRSIYSLKKMLKVVNKYERH
jgi:hypothetical protein